MPALAYPSLTSLAYLGFHLNVFAEGGADTLTFDEVYDGLDNGSLWAVINAKHPRMDLTMFTTVSPDQGNAVVAALLEAAQGMRGRETRKYGIQSSGLALLLAYVLEAIQSEHWVPADSSRFQERPSN